MPCHLRGMCEGTDSRCATTVTVRGTRLRIRGLSGFLCLSFFAAAKKVSAAPHRGNANRPISIQGKATAAGRQTKRAAGNQIKERPPRRRQPDQGKPTTAGRQTKRAAGNQIKKK